MKKKILLIEDEKVLVEMYNEKFSEAGYEIISAFEAREGLKLAKKEKPDLIILDILLPREDGIFFLKEQKKDPEIASIPVVALSNYDNPEAKREALDLGVKDYLIKTDFTPQEIIEKVKEYLS
ncbi:response regulator [Patescibacteria group bacterium]|nr:response regulator [Patescibacteria group bacterium]